MPETIYAWVKDMDTNLDTCVTGNIFCMHNSAGQPVLSCSLNRNKEKPMCSDTVKADSSYRVLGCYNTPNCGGHVMDEDMYRTTHPPCAQEICKDEPTEENCIQLREGVQRPENMGTYCYLGGKMNNYDPCRLSIIHGGADFCPKQCFHKHCCPGNITF